MSADHRSFEAAFEPIDESLFGDETSAPRETAPGEDNAAPAAEAPAAPPASDGVAHAEALIQAEAKGEADMADFRDFFARLSSLDNLRWKPEPAQTKPERPTARRPAAPQAPHPAAAARRIEVVHSDDADIADTTVHADDADARAVEAALHHVRTWRLVRMALVGVLLFCIGLGGGWLALKLPARFERAMPGLSKLIDQGHLAPVRTTRPPKAARDGDREAAQAAAAATPTTAESAVADTAGEPPAVELPRAGGAETPQSGAAATEPTGRTQASRAAGTPAAATDTGPRYAIQVGACSSYRCVERYRTMLLRVVSARSIEVVTQRTDSGAIERIRLAPMPKAEAEQTRQRLVAADTRLKDAYLIAVQ